MIISVITFISCVGMCIFFIIWYSKYWSLQIKLARECYFITYIPPGGKILFFNVNVFMDLKTHKHHNISYFTSMLYLLLLKWYSCDPEIYEMNSVVHKIQIFLGVPWWWINNYMWANYNNVVIFLFVQFVNYLNENKWPKWGYGLIAYTQWKVSVSLFVSASACSDKRKPDGLLAYCNGGHTYPLSSSWLHHGFV